MNSNAAAALIKENELVELLAAVAKVFTNQRASTPEEMKALGAWEPDLLRHRDINNILIGHANNGEVEAFETMAAEELNILSRFIENLNENGSSVEKGFREHFVDDRNVLLAMVES